MCYQNRLHVKSIKLALEIPSNMLQIYIDKTIVNVTQKSYTDYREWQKKIIIYIDRTIPATHISKKMEQYKIITIWIIVYCIY